MRQTCYYLYRYYSPINGERTGKLIDIIERNRGEADRKFALQFRIPIVKAKRYFIERKG